MSRSLKKSLFVNEKLRNKIENKLKIIAEIEKQGDKHDEIAKIRNTPIKVWCRNSVIFPEMIGFKVLIHNGKTFFERVITSEMVNYKLGVFSPTRKPGKHGKAGTR